MTYQDYFKNICNRLNRGYYAVTPTIYDVGNLGIKSKVTEEGVEIPFLGASIILNKLASEYTLGNYIIPISLEGRNRYAVAKSSNPIFKQFFYDNLGYLVLTSRYGKEVKYWGNKGIILYDDFTPLMLVTFTAKRLNNTDRIELDIDKVKIYINPLIYTKNDLIAKAIRGKMLEELCTFKYTNAILGIPRYNTYNTRDCALVLKNDFFANNIEIEVSDKINNFIIIPKIPTINDSNEAIQDFISKNADLIL